MIKDISVLYIGSLAGWSNSLRRFKTLEKLCRHAKAVDTDPYVLMKFFSGFQHHFNIGPGIFLLNRKIRKEISRARYDIVYVDNKSYLLPGTLRFIKQKSGSTKIAGILTDDPFGLYTKSWRLLKKTIPLFDIFFVQRKVNIVELKSRGAKKVEVCYRSYDPGYNRPLKLSREDYEKYHATVGFVGTYENVRAGYIAYLIRNGIPVYVTGNDWPGAEYWDVIRPFYRGPSVFEEEYIKAVNGLDIALHFLRHANRDEQDSRTFEIPACGVFMIAEGSELHEQLFEKNREAVFFYSKEELLEKVKYYLHHIDEARAIAKAGYIRCTNSGYTHQDRIKYVLDTIMYE